MKRKFSTILALSSTVIILTILFLAGGMSAKATYQFTCPEGTILRQRKDFTDQQVEGTVFAGFTCCPTSHPSLHYFNENYFCCPAGTGAYCRSNSCNCKGSPIKGGKYPDILQIS